MARTPTGDDRALLASVRDDWIRDGLSTEPADRKSAKGAVWRAYDAVDHDTGSMMYLWVDSPMAGVIASTYLGLPSASQ